MVDELNCSRLVAIVTCVTNATNALLLSPDHSLELDETQANCRVEPS